MTLEEAKVASIRCHYEDCGRDCPGWEIDNCAEVVKTMLSESAASTAKADYGKPHMGYEERKAVYSDAIERWGSHAQTLMAIEEMGELINALCKLRRDRCSVHDVAEEIADVTIMMEQLRMIFYVNEEVSGIMDKKIERLRKRLFSFGEEGEHG